MAYKGFVAFLVVAAGTAGMARAATLARPNILFIVADDLGWGDVGSHGGFGKTPHMDRLVCEGVELDRHYVQPVCTPTRAALMTGRYPGRFGPQAIHPSNLRSLPPGTQTLASALKSLGYATFQAGKWHLGSRPEWGPSAYGFDHSYGTLTGAADPWTHKRSALQTRGFQKHCDRRLGLRRAREGPVPQHGGRDRRGRRDRGSLPQNAHPRRPAVSREVLLHSW